MWEYIRDAAVTWFIGFFPLFEIYVAVPAGIALGLGAVSAVFWSVFGNYTPVLLIEFGYERLMRIERVREWLTRRISQRFERSVNRYGPWFVLLITPWTGVWVMAVTAKALGMKRSALLAYSFVSVLAYAIILALAADNLVDLSGWSTGAANFSLGTNQIVILVLLVYAFTFGKRDFQRLSAWIKRRGADGTEESLSEAPGSGDVHGEPEGTADGEGRVASQEPAYDWARARKERAGFYKHAAVFVVAHILVFAVDWAMASVPLSALIESWQADGTTGILPFNNPIFAKGSSVWALVLVIDAIISFSYTVFPKRKKRSA